MAEPDDLSAHAARNRAVWNADAPNWVESGRRRGRAPAVVGDVGDPGGGASDPSGRCRARCARPRLRDRYWCAWFARLGARPVGLDLSEEQLATARELQAEHGIEFPLIHASAEAPPLPDGSFDLVFSEYGAAIWCDPYVWIPRRTACCGPAGGSSSSATRCSSSSALRSARSRRARRSFGRRRAWERSNGRTTTASTSISPTASGSAAARHRLRGRGAPRAVRAGRRPGRGPLLRARLGGAWPCEEVWVARRTDR